MQTVTGHLCSALGLLRGARTDCSQAVSLALARRVGLASTRLGLAITRLARTLCDRVRLGLVHLSLALTQLARTLTALRIISRGIWFGFLWVVLIISIGHHVIGQHSFWDELPIWVLFLGVENKTEGVIKESFELKLPPASEGGEGGGGGGDMWWEEFQLPANHRFLLLFNIPHLHSKHESPAEVKHWRKDDVVGAWWRL